MSVSEFTASMLAVAPSALLDYAFVAFAVKLPLRLRFRWGVHGLPIALVLMAALHTWQQPVWVSGVICLGAALSTRAAQAVAALAKHWLLRPTAARLVG